MRGASPVSRVQQAESEIGTWLRSNLADPSGELRMLLQRNLIGSELLLSNLDQPLSALGNYCKRLLASENRLRELVRQTDVEWGREMDERPYFDQEGAAPHPDDPYTFESVRRTLTEVLERLPAEAAAARKDVVPGAGVAHAYAAGGDQSSTPPGAAAMDPLSRTIR